MEMKPRMIDIPSGPQGGLVYNPDPYKSAPCPYRMRDLCEHLKRTGKTWETLSDEERERFRIPGR